MKNILKTYTFEDWLLASLRLLVGALFVFSGFVKLLPIEPFELKFIEFGLSWTFAPYMARIVIGGEMFLGLLLIFNIKPRLTSIAILAILIFFNLYLLYDIFKNGNDGNCGCFGTFFVMTPLESIVKNCLMIPFVVFIIYKNKRELTVDVLITIAIIATIAMSSPFLMSPLRDPESNRVANSLKGGYPFPIELMPDFKVNNTKIDLTKGEHILVFMSVKCSHCKKLAYKLQIIAKQNELPPIYMVLLSEVDEVPIFINETKADFPYYIFNEDDFLTITGNTIPRLFHIKNGNVMKKFDDNLTEEELLKSINGN